MSTNPVPPKPQKSSALTQVNAMGSVKAASLVVNNSVSFMGADFTPQLKIDTVVDSIVDSLVTLGFATANEWKQRLAVANPDSGLDPAKPVAVGLSGDWLAVGGVGRVRVYHLDTDAWAAPTPLAPLDPVGSSARFGESLGIDGTVLVVGDPGRGSYGAAYVFQLSGGAWLLTHTFDGVAGHALGFSTSVSGNVFASGNPTSSTHVGSVDVFVDLAPAHQLVPSDNNGQAGFGSSVAVCTTADGVRTVVGGPNDGSGLGAVWVFLDGVQTHKIIGILVTGAARMGYSVATHGDFLAFGAPNDYFNNGSVYVYKLGATSDWESVFRGPARLTGAIEPAGVGFCVAMAGGFLVVGGPQNSFARGSAWVLELTSGDGGDATWTQVSSRITPSGAQVLKCSSVACDVSGAAPRFAVTSKPGTTLDVAGPAAWVFELERAE